MKSAPIYFGTVAQILDDYLTKNDFSSIFFLVDENTHVHCLPLLLASLNHLAEYEILEIDSGEENKNIETASDIWITLSDLKANRHSLLINVGGGVLTDIGGFVASTFKRGIKFINIPTTLLSMVDASAGGKNGIDLEGMKNIIGTFSQPEMVLVDPNFLFTLEERQVKSGLAEMLKHGLIKDKNHWNNLVRLQVQDVTSLTPFILDSIRIKESVVENDPYEKGERKILNFGHTIGHAIESESMNTENPLLHGEAIALGMVIESFLSYDHELISKSEMIEIFESLSSIYQLDPIDINVFPNLMDWMMNDKKNQNNLINFSLINKIGHCRYNINCTELAIKQALETYNKWLSP